MSRAGIARWVPLIAGFAAGQGAILALNLVTGFLILRFLSIEQYALYILASLLQSLGSLGTDLGMSQGVVSIGAPLREDKRAFGALIRAAVRLRARLFVVAVALVLASALALFPKTAISVEVAFAATALALAISWTQQSAGIATAVLNANHDSAGLLKAGISSAVGRLVLTATVCSVAPYALVALAINLAGAALTARMQWRRCARHAITVGSVDSKPFVEKLTTFMRPLLPGIVYYFLQGHISTFLLAFAGATVAIAEVGALGRLGQIISVLLLVNGFFVQPYFARISDRERFTARAIQTIGVLAVSCVVVTLSAIVAPSAWLAILGSKYSGLGNELVIALVGTQLSVAAAMVYTIVIATKRTRGQWLQIPLGLSAQILFILLFGISGARDALLLNMIPGATSLAVEIALLAYVIVSWPNSPSSAKP